MTCTSPISTDPIGKAPPCWSIPSSSPLGQIFASSSTEAFNAGEIVLLEGDEAESVFEVVDGVLRIYRSLVDGRRAVTGFLYPADVIGLALNERYVFTAEAITDAQLRRLGREKLHDAVSQSADLQRCLLSVVGDELSAAQDQMLLLARKTAQERVASFFLVVGRKTSCGAEFASEIVLPMTRLDIADYLGLTVETVSRVLARLKAEGVIRIPAPNRIIVQNRSVLRQLAASETSDDLGFRAQRRAVWPT